MDGDDDSVVSLASRELLELTGVLEFSVIKSVVNDSEEVVWGALETEEAELTTGVLMTSVTVTGLSRERGGALLGPSVVSVVDEVLLSPSMVDVGLV